MSIADKLLVLFKKIKRFLLKDGKERLEECGVNPKGGKIRYFDRHVEGMIIEFFKKRSSHSIKIISEERSEPILIGKFPPDYTIICDPVNGSDNYVHGYHAVACAMAVVPGNLPITLNNIQYALVGSIFSNEVFTAEKGYGAFLNGRKLPLRKDSLPLSNALINVDFDHGDKKSVRNYARLLDIVRIAEGQRRTGSSCLDICWGLAKGGVSAFVDLRDELSPENFLASFAVAREVGCVLTDENGRDLRKKNFSDLSQRYNIICATNKKLINEIVSIINNPK